MGDESYENINEKEKGKMSEPPKKKAKLSQSEKERDDEKSAREKAVLARAELEMMMASEGHHGSYDPEDAQMEPEELAKRLDKRLKRNWRLRWLIKKAVKKKLAEQDEFEFDETDERFGALTEDPEYAMDPMSNKFDAKSKVMKRLLHTTRRKREQRWHKKNRGVLLKGKRKRAEKVSEMDADSLIASIKAKSAAIPKLINAQQQRKNLTQKLKGLASIE